MPVVNGMSSITSAGLTSCIWAGSKFQGPTRRSIERACTTQVEAFWSNSIQKKGMKAKMERTRKTAFTPSTASSGWSARAPSRNEPARPRFRSALRTTSRKEWGFFPVAGIFTYWLRPSQKMTVAIPIRIPGMPKATAGPKRRRVLGISREAKKLPRLMLQ